MALETRPKFVGVLSCSGEEEPEGTIARNAVRLVMEKYRPGITVSLCLPLYLAGDGGEREFAKKVPVIAVDGCEQGLRPALDREVLGRSAGTPSISAPCCASGGWRTSSRALTPASWNGS